MLVKKHRRDLSNPEPHLQWLGECVGLVYVGGSAGRNGYIPVLRQGFICRVKDSGGRHSYLVEVSWGFLRPSVEETLAFNRLRSVGEEEEARAVGTYQIGFLLSSFCLSFVFLACVSYVLAFVIPWLSHAYYVYYSGMPVPLSLHFFCYVWSTLLKKAPKREWWLSCSGPLLDKVCLSLERGFASMYSGPGECSVEVCLVCWPV